MIRNDNIPNEHRNSTHTPISVTKLANKICSTIVKAKKTNRFFPSYQNRDNNPFGLEIGTSIDTFLNAIHQNYNTFKIQNDFSPYYNNNPQLHQHWGIIVKGLKELQRHAHEETVFLVQPPLSLHIGGYKITGRPDAIINKEDDLFFIRENKSYKGPRLAQCWLNDAIQVTLYGMMAERRFQLPDESLTLAQIFYLKSPKISTVNTFSLRAIVREFVEIED